METTQTLFTSPTTTPQKTTEETAKLTIASCLEAILKDYQENKGINEESDSFPKKEYDFVCRVLEITPIQAVLLASILEICVGSDATPDKIARNLGCTNLHFLELRNEIDVLSDKRYVRSSTRSFKGLSYRVTDAAIKCIQKNRKPDCSDITGLSSYAMLRRFHLYFKDMFRDNLDYECLVTEIGDVIRYNPDNILVQELSKVGFDSFADYERMVFLYMLCRYVGNGDESFGLEDYGRILSEDGSEDIFVILMESESLMIQKSGLVEFGNNNGIADPTHLILTDSAKENLLKGVPGETMKKVNGVNLVGASTIASKELFYNKSIQSQVDSLTDLLSKENFQKVVDRLSEKGLRSGFSCLFYGPAGTGKTETVNQLSRATGRDIYVVDVSEIKSKWVGESEKNIKALFREYRKLVKNSELCPILLFNEADAIFGVRKKGAEDAVDKMENSIQNIILQEMETLDGILIATTNLTKNFDSAFERRFIYKIKFDKPGADARAKIWTALIEELDFRDAEKLAEEFEFSGGQIENISRKMTVEYILSGKTPQFDQIREFCLQETLDKTTKRAKIGF